VPQIESADYLTQYEQVKNYFDLSDIKFEHQPLVAQG